MILKTGNKGRPNPKFNNKGFTFTEVMLAIVIFSVGIIGIYRSFIISLDRMSLLTNRFYANIALDNQITSIERTLRNFKALPVELDSDDQIDTGSKHIQFQKQINIGQLPELKDIFSLDLTLEWDEKDRKISISRSAYLTNFNDE